MKHACGTTRQDLQLVQKEHANALLLTSPPNSACLPGRQISDSSPAVAAAKGGENPSAGAATISPSTATRSGTGLDGPSRSSRNLRGRKAAAKCLPWSARQCSGRAASSRSPSSRGGASWDAAHEPLTPGKRAALPAARLSPRARSRPLRPSAAGPPSLGPWGFASCRAMGTLHTSRPLPRSAPLRGAQPLAPRSSPGISGPGAGGRGRREARLAGSCCFARSGLRGAAASPVQRPGPHGAAAGAGRGSHSACLRAPARPGQRGWNGRRPEPPPPGGLPQTEWVRLRAAGAGGCWARSGPSLRLLPLRPALLARLLGLGLELRLRLRLPGRECYCSSERRLIDKEST